MLKIENLGKTDNYVYDISLDGTVVNALGLNIASNTDGFNFQLPDDDKYRYTDENPYISSGMSRETKEGQAYTGFKADVAEFNDIFMRDFHYSPKAVNKLGLGIDEVLEASINFSRKNYADYFPEKPFPGDVKLVGNTIKSKKMPEYVAKFLSKAIRMLLRGEGSDFLDEYYRTMDNIINLRIPLKDIASKGKIKKSIEEYKNDVKKVTKAGRTNSRQAWYELVIKEGLEVSNGDTIYYINTGEKKSQSDIKKVTKYYAYSNGQKTDVTKEFTKEFNEYRKQKKVSGTIDEKMKFGKAKYGKFNFEEEVEFNCILLPNEILNKEGDAFCSDISDTMTYNIPKYVEQFNNRITPLLVCFKKEIRDKILITKMEDRPYFTTEQCELCAGEPNNPKDQDTYEALLTMTDNEIEFWRRNNLIPPFTVECGMGTWEEILARYDERKEEEKRLGIDKIRESYVAILNDFTNEELLDMVENNVLDEKLLKIVTYDTTTNAFLSVEYPDVVIGTFTDIADILEEHRNDFFGEIE